MDDWGLLLASAVADEREWWEVWQVPAAISAVVVSAIFAGFVVLVRRAWQRRKRIAARFKAMVGAVARTLPVSPKRLRAAEQKITDLTTQLTEAEESADEAAAAADAAEKETSKLRQLLRGDGPAWARGAREILNEASSIDDAIAKLQEAKDDGRFHASTTGRTVLREAKTGQFVSKAGKGAVAAPRRTLPIPRHGLTRPGPLITDVSSSDWVVEHRAGELRITNRSLSESTHVVVEVMQAGRVESNHRISKVDAASNIDVPATSRIDAHTSVRLTWGPLGGMYRTTIPIGI